MKRLFLKIALLFGIVLNVNATACAQLDSASICNKIHYSDEMDKAAQECWENSTEREAKLIECLSTWNNLKDELGALQLENVSLNEENKALEEDLDKFKKKSKRRGLVALGAGGGLLLTLILTLGIK